VVYWKQNSHQKVFIPKYISQWQTSEVFIHLFLLLNLYPPPIVNICFISFCHSVGPEKNVFFAFVYIKAMLCLKNFFTRTTSADEGHIWVSNLPLVLWATLFKMFGKKSLSNEGMVRLSKFKFSFYNNFHKNYFMDVTELWWPSGLECLSHILDHSWYERTAVQIPAMPYIYCIYDKGIVRIIVRLSFVYVWVYMVSSARTTATDKLGGPWFKQYWSVEWLSSSFTPALSKYSICVLVMAINTHELIRSINWRPVLVVQVLVVV
jgi:hypothetical protein